MRVLNLFATAAAVLAAGVVAQTDPAAVLGQIPACTVSPSPRPCLGILLTYILHSKNAASKCWCQRNAHYRTCQTVSARILLYNRRLLSV